MDRAIRGGRTSYGAYFQIVRRNGIRQWTHVRARILRDDRGSPRRIIGIVRNATTELTEFAEVSPAEAGRRRLTAIVQGTTEALSHAVTVDDVTAVLSDAGGLERFGADGLALGLVDGDSFRLVALSGASIDVLGNWPSARWTTRCRSPRPPSPSAPASPPRSTNSWPRSPAAPVRPPPRLRRGGLPPLVAQARSVGGLALFYRDRTHFSAEDRNVCLGLAGIVAQSLQRAILFDKEREFATGLQASMLPRDIPAFTGAEIAARSSGMAWSSPYQRITSPSAPGSGSRGAVWPGLGK